MFFQSHFLSERTQTALLILYALRRSYLSGGGGISKKEIIALTGFSNTAVNNFLSHLHTMKLVGIHERKFYPGRNLGSASLYDLIEYMDGWVHLGNANLERVTGNVPDRMYLSGCEACIRKGINDYLKSILLTSLLPGAEEPLAESSVAVTAHSESAGTRDGRAVHSESAGNRNGRAASTQSKTFDLPATPVHRPGRPKRSGIAPETRMIKEGFR